METWSLEKELLKLSQKNSLADAIYSLNLLPKDEKFISLDESESEWTRGGAETYIYKFFVIISQIRFSETTHRLQHQDFP